MTFREFMSEPAQNPATNAAAIASGPKLPKAPTSGKWKATKEEILEYWKNLRPDRPIMMKPIEYLHKGSTYGEDGVRLTGSPEFIGSALARLKELLAYETPSTKLGVTFRQTESPSQMAVGRGKTSYVFYASVKQRGVKTPTPPTIP